MKLYAPIGSYRAAKALVAAQYVNAPVEFVNTNEDASILDKVCPDAQLPILETADGILMKSNAITRFIARLRPDLGLYGQNYYEQAQIDSWLEWSNTDLEPSVNTWVLPILGHMAEDGKATAAARDETKNCLKGLNAHLAKCTFLVGHQVTLADIVVASALVLPFRIVIDANTRKGFTNVERWFNTLVNQPEFVAIFGKVFLCTKSQIAIKGAGPKGADNKKKDKKGKKDEPKKAEKKEEKKEEPKKVEKKAEPAVDPAFFGHMEWWKRLYSNAKDKRAVMKEFWEKFDSKVSSIYFIYYEKAEGEGEKLFLTSNLVNGFLQRLDKLRKTCFAVHGVYGEEPSLEIRGCWYWDGADVHPEMKEHPSSEWHKFVKADPTKEADRKLVEDFWCNFEDDMITDGLRCRDGAYYK
mmetsp:Transcript_13052/g.14366  ORF Transcript_13052/g.14366 Transcript_13052/m.14366 type:complete len:411 (-) Transcript_13052:261-1493(-)|eukprot:CAMPEP_0115027598 /NCGR_PEP_ID=MMETSP0216-20121206/35646_1 /TAXON_ID=223996 /ORGANISM="Protocruzia adherens, Strain Boccale" /LENGTH=410 /DNA_ID=CAMNT_0002403313 /DNA_START=49 /DNA_END=1281 /DNA_ORIENTATION=+